MYIDIEYTYLNYILCIGRIIIATPIIYAIVITCGSMHIVIKATMSMLFIQSVYFIFNSMIGILMKRFQEIQARYKLHIRMQWFTPLSSQELDKLNTVLDMKKSEKHSI